jgi:hypothetical protein
VVTYTDALSADAARRADAQLQRAGGAQPPQAAGSRQASGAGPPLNATGGSTPLADDDAGSSLLLGIPYGKSELFDDASYP